MSERIKELAEQAGEYANSVYTPPVRSGPGTGKIWEDGHIDWHTHFNQKFALLIVRECVAIADEYDGVGSTIVSRINEHFGVDDKDNG